MIPFPDKKYQIIYADPPWRYGDKVLNKGHGGRFDALSRHYETMSTEDIKNLPVDNISESDCALFMWTTDSHLPDALEVMKSWGFEYKTVSFYWIKTSKIDGLPKSNLGKWTQKNIEMCLFGTKGKMQQYLRDRTVNQLAEEPRSEHSKKPAVFRDRIVRLFGAISRIELFARKDEALFDAFCFEGWDVWGNEVCEEIV